MFWQTMSGDEGQVVVPAIGAVVGVMRKWSLKRREESSPGDPGLLTLRADFSWVNPAMMSEESLSKHVLITIRRDKHYRVCGERMAFDGATLVMENATLCQPE